MTEHTPEGKLLELIRKAQSKVNIGRDLRVFTKVNILLIGLIAIVAIIFLLDIFVFKEKPSEEPVLDTQAKIPQAQPVLEKIEEDDAMEQANLDKNINIKKIPKEEIMGNLNLLGIITSDNNQAIIEDKTLKKTFFLYKGDMFGDLKVHDIKDNLVILDYDGEKIELHM